MKSRLRRENFRNTFSTSSPGDAHRAAGNLIWERPLPQIRILGESPDEPAVKVLTTGVPSGEEFQLDSLGPEWFCERVSATAFDELPKKDRLKLAALWYREATFERESAAHLAQLSHSLLSSGAPLALLKASARSYLEELEHARLCFSMSRALLGSERAKFRERLATDELAGFEVFDEVVANGAEVVIGGAGHGPFDLAWSSLRQGVLAQELVSKFSVQLSRHRDFAPIAAELLKKSVDERRQSDLHWDVFSWSLKKLGKDSVQRLWVMWTHLPKPRFADALLGDGKMRDLYRETREELSERLRKYFELEWKMSVGENSPGDRALPISRPAS